MLLKIKIFFQNSDNKISFYLTKKHEVIMIIKNIIITLVLIIFSISCEIEMTPKQSKPAPYINNSDPQDRADEPVMLGGAYLTCAKLNKTSNNISCGLIDKNSSKKIDLQHYKHKWLVVDTTTQNLVDIPIQILKDNPFYHIELFYKDDSYKIHTVMLNTFNTKQEIIQSFNKNLSSLDTEIIELEYNTISNKLSKDDKIYIMKYIMNNKCPPYPSKKLIFSPWQNHCVYKNVTDLFPTLSWLKTFAKDKDIIDKIFVIQQKNNKENPIIACSTDLENRDKVLNDYLCDKNSNKHKN